MSYHLNCHTMLKVKGLFQVTVAFMYAKQVVSVGNSARYVTVSH